MSDTNAPVEHGDQKGENAKFFTFVNLALFMAVVTGIELIVIFMPFPNWLVFTLIIGLSVVKFVGVITWFMHLIYDKRLCSIMFIIGMILALGTFTALTVLFSPKDVEGIETRKIEQSSELSLA